MRKGSTPTLPLGGSTCKRTGMAKNSGAILKHVESTIPVPLRYGVLTGCLQR